MDSATTNSLFRSSDIIGRLESPDHEGIRQLLQKKGEPALSTTLGDVKESYSAFEKFLHTAIEKKHKGLNNKDLNELHRLAENFAQMLEGFFHQVEERTFSTQELGAGDRLKAAQYASNVYQSVASFTTQLHSLISALSSPQQK